jgi:uncharacterized protein (TIGR00251 family)
MRISLSVKAGAKTEKILKIDEKNYKLWVKAPAKEGKANEAVVKALAKHFGTAKSNVEIKSGFKSKKKIVEIK